MKQSLADKIANKPLSRKQKGIVAMLYKAAYDRAKLHHADDGLTAEQWRHRECRAATADAQGNGGVRSSEAKQRHWKDLMRHGHNLAGNSGAALKTELRDDAEARREPVRNLIRAAVEKFAPFGMTHEYAKTLTKGKHPADMDERELEQWLFTITARGTRMQQLAPDGIAGSATLKE